MYQRQTSRDRRSLLVAVFLAIGIVGYFGFRSAPEPSARGACVRLNVAASPSERLVPYSATNNLVKHQVVLFPALLLFTTAPPTCLRCVTLCRNGKHE